ncbi:MAG: DUF2989 domain-containing protein [Litorilituus sp.]|jgi:hypothetical protein|nr:DUF2989 domain-containing protein [Litorilituus sp.]
MKLIPLLLTLCLLFSCDSSKNLTELCQENPKICQEFSEDSWCKSERNELSLSRISLKTLMQEAQQYSVLIAYEEYITCMSLASQIQHTKLKEKTTLRKNNLYKAQAKLAELTIRVANSTHPHLLFYLWSREANKVALQQFLALEGSTELENSISQQNLASYYVKKDIKKTLGLLFHALELQQPNEKLVPEIFQTLATIFTNKDKPKQAYIWLKVYQLTLKKKSKHVVLSLKQLEKGHDLDIPFLNKVAFSTLKKIKSGQFKSPKH